MTPTYSNGQRRTEAPSIRANSRQLDDRFPIAGFTVNCARKRFFEVLLATDRMLFHPAHARRRHRSNFYSSREDSGLIPSSVEVYIAPSSVLQRFAGAPAIYYTTVAYDSRAMDGAEPADDPEVLAQEAPSISLSAAFTGKTLSKVLGVALSDLRRVREDEGSYIGTPAHAAEMEWSSAAEDLGEGEDGYGLSAALPPQGYYESPASSLSGDYGDGYEPETGALDYQKLAPLSAGLEEDRADDLSPRARAAEDDSDEESYSLESTYPAGAQIPGMLEDEDYPGESDAPGARTSTGQAYDDGFGDMDGEDNYSSSYAAGYPDDESWSAAAGAELNGAAKRNIMLAVSGNESASFANRYEAINPQSGPPHGLVFGIIQFTQASGSLGMLAEAMKNANRAKFEEVFGPNTGELLATLNASLSGHHHQDGESRNARVQPVAPERGKPPVDLWQAPWKERFTRSAAPDLFGRGSEQIFNRIQDELAVQLYLDPMLPMAKWLGLNEDRMLGVIMDRAVAMGLGGARKWIMRKVLRTGLADAQVQQALGVLKHPDLKSFQRTIPGLRSDGGRGPMTDAALLFSLRGAAGGPPFPIPSEAQIKRDLLEGAQTDYAARTERILKSALLTGATYSL
jgi:hypothetical protein